MATMDRWTIRAETFLDDFWITRLASNRSEQVDNVGIPLPMAEPQIGPCGVVPNQQARICEIFNLPSSLVLQSCNLLVPVPLISQLSQWVEGISFYLAMHLDAPSRIAFIQSMP